MPTSTISAERMRIDAELGINENFDTADKHALRWNQTAERSNILNDTRTELQKQLGKPLTLLNLILSWVLVIAVFSSFVLLEAMINRDSFSTIFGKISTSQWEDIVAIIAGAAVAIINMAAGHAFASTIMNAEENAVSGRKMYDRRGIIVPLLWITSYILFQQFLIKSASGGYGEYRAIQLMSFFLALLEFGSAFLLLNRLNAIILGLTMWQIRRANRILARERSKTGQAYAEYTSQLQRYNELYPQHQLQARHSNYIDVCLGLQSKPPVQEVATEEIGEDVEVVLEDFDADNNANNESSSDYQL